LLPIDDVSGAALESPKIPLREQTALVLRVAVTTDVLTEKIRGILKQHGKLPTEIATLGDSADLYSAGLTSQASVGLMLALEGAFDIEFPDKLLNRKTFESVAAIRGVVAQLTGGR
jgi:acyl carrier protein